MEDTNTLVVEQRAFTIKNLVQNMKQISDVNVLKRTELFKKYAKMAYSGTLVGIQKEDEVKNSIRVVESNIEEEEVETNRPPNVIMSNGSSKSTASDVDILQRIRRRSTQKIRI